MTDGIAVGERVLVAALVAAVVVVGAGLMPAFGGPDRSQASGPEHPEYDVDRLAPDRLAAAGEPDPDGDVGVVLFDQSHGNRFATEDVAPLTRAITEAGGEVRFTGAGGALQAQLDGADVLVVVDPAQEYEEEEVQAIETFVDEGGRVLVLGEPNRRAIQREGVGPALTTQRSQLASLSTAFGISFGTQYLYDMEANDGNFKAIVTGPPDGADAPAVEGVERVAMYTAAAVDVERGTVLLRTAPTAERVDGGPADGFPVAVTTAGGAVMAVGDTTFLADENADVGDNDVFVERIVEFMAGADAVGDDSDDGQSQALASSRAIAPVRSAS